MLEFLYFWGQNCNLKQSDIIIMKKVFILIIILCANKTIAQDIIVMKDGSAILSKVLEINPSDVKYKKHSNLNGPTYTINKTDIMTITYENGEKEVINNNSDNTIDNNNGSNRYIKKKAAANNAKLISSYNGNVNVNTKKKRKPNGCINIYGVSSTSIMSNDDIEVKIQRANDIIYNYIWAYYYIVLFNKTERPIYIDLGNCFRIEKDGSFYCYFTNTEQTTITQGGGSGGSIGLGSVAGVLGIGGIAGQLASGVTVGGGTSHSVSKTYSSQRIKAIPPHSKINLTDYKRSEAVKRGNFLFSYDDYEILERPESFNSFIKNFTKRNSNFIDFGEIIHYKEENTPYSREYIVTYSPSESFETYSTLDFKLYIRESIGIREDKVKSDDFTVESENIIWDYPYGESWD